ncbi:MAG: hypothetical protein ACE5I1_32285 [bacterium]
MTRKYKQYAHKLQGLFRLYGAKFRKENFMWHILKAEFQYMKLGILIAYGIGVLLLILAINWGLDTRLDLAGVELRFFLPQFGNLYSLMANTSTAVIIAVIIIGVQSDQEKRDRFYARLPLPIRTTGLARLLFMLLFQAGMVLLWLILFLLEPPAETMKAIYTMIGVNEFWLGIIVVLLLWHDLGQYGTFKFRGLFLAVVGLVASGYAWSIFNRFDEMSAQQLVDRFLFYQTPAGAALVSGIFIGLLYLSIWVFARRRLYLE